MEVSFNFTLRLFFYRVRAPVPIDLGGGRIGLRTGLDVLEKIKLLASARIRIPGRRVGTIPSNTKF